jgi:hypothetical protein
MSQSSGKDGRDGSSDGGEIGVLLRPALRRQSVACKRVPDMATVQHQRYPDPKVWAIPDGTILVSRTMMEDGDG